MKHYLSIFFSSILAGMCIFLGATVFLLVLPTNKVLASFLFTLGLFTIIQFGFHLYTGKIGFVLDNKPSYLIDLVIILVTNLLSAAAFSYLMSLTKMGATLHETAIGVVDSKYNDSWYSVLILSFFCGIMIYLAVKGHQVCPYPVGKAFLVIMPVMLFIICGHEHIVANASYFAYAHKFDLKTVFYFFLMLVGNSLGSIFFDCLIKLTKKFLPKEENK